MKSNGNKVCPRLLLVEDDDSLRRVLAHQISHSGFEVVQADSAEAALEILAQQDFDLILTDMRLGGMDGIELIERVRILRPETVMLMLTAHATVAKAVEAMKAGAFDFLTKPVDGPTLQANLEKALAFRRLGQENRRLKEKLSLREAGGIVGVSDAVRDCIRMAERVAPSDTTVMITGESGTGKELFARAIHEKSHRAGGPFVAINCAAIPDDLLESELFGYARGAFTGAVREKRGKFEAATGGTLFLDEIGEMPPKLQPKLLRVLEERAITRLGENRAHPVDVRILAGTNADLAARIADGRFREDLYFRLNVVPLRLPSLRERAEDIPLLLHHFSRRFNGPNVRWDEGAVRLLTACEWKGNVRELANLVERMMVLRTSDVIGVSDLPPEFRLGPQAAAKPGVKAIPSFRDAEAALVREALERCQGNQSRAARLLKIPRHVLIYRMKKHRIPPYEAGE